MPIYEQLDCYAAAVREVVEGLRYLIWRFEDKIKMPDKTIEFQILRAVLSVPKCGILSRYIYNGVVFHLNRDIR